ncbi:uncharacterized protein TRIADDRAFT_62578 [Trichoplax adhaerens]|uniref:Uncharacterized protein n=1 Tax=Trichoplax adhaerens TaxID=10228 RepID=B3SE80_TRIAD|nr:predicted protein [Trichoplax adhaerens]EDV18965.1 predicted protein [Trichoplax adhaerens]|eukprot:XP_002118549.1 predicted protein [Trichoplax adhaerens]
MVDLEVYGTYDRRLYDLSHILDANIKAIIASLVNTQEIIQTPSVTTSADLQAKVGYPSVNTDSSCLADMKLNTASTSAFESSDTSTTSPHSLLDLQQRQDVFLHYFSSVLNKNEDIIGNSQYAKIWDFGNHSIYYATQYPFLSGNDNENKDSQGNSQFAKIRDFGCHSIYHDTHHPLLSGNSIYILVFNITQNINDKVKIT